MNPITQEMKDHDRRLFKEIVIWNGLMTTHYNGIAVLMILPDNRYVVKSADFCRWPLDKDQPAQQDYYYLDALFQDASGSFRVRLCGFVDRSSFFDG